MVRSPVNFSLTLSGGFDKVAACRLSLSRLAARHYRHLLILINALHVFCSLCQEYSSHCAVSSFTEDASSVPPLLDARRSRQYYSYYKPHDESSQPNDYQIFHRVTCLRFLKAQLSFPVMPCSYRN